jgi:hypothetical protein
MSSTMTTDAAFNGPLSGNVTDGADDGTVE